MNCSTKCVIRTDLLQQLFSKELIRFSRSSERCDLIQEVFWENWSGLAALLTELIWFGRSFESWCDPQGLLRELIWFSRSSESTARYRHLHFKNLISSDRPSEWTDLFQRFVSEQLNCMDTSGPQTDTDFRRPNILGCPIPGNTEDL